MLLVSRIDAELRFVAVSCFSGLLNNRCAGGIVFVASQGYDSPVYELYQFINDAHCHWCEKILAMQVWQGQTRFYGGYECHAHHDLA